MKNLYLIGNGFDLHHGLHTSYLDFKKWLKYVHPIIYQELVNIYGRNDKEWWRDFENNLGKLDVIRLREKYHKEVPQYLWKEVRKNCPDGLRPSVEWSPAGNRLKSLYYLLDVAMKQWLTECQMHIPTKKMISIDTEESYFISFNYTTLLENLYMIPRTQILYIHGRLGEEDPIIWGHSKDSSTLSWQYEKDGGLSPDDSDMQKIEMSFGEKQKNPYEYIYGHLDVFFNMLKEVETIYVYGMSFSEVDLDYFTHIRRIAPDATWVISWYDDKTRQHIEEVCKSILFLLKESQIKESQIKWIQLNDLIIPQNNKSE